MPYGYERIFQPEVYTEHVPAKLAISAATLAGVSAFDAACGLNHMTATVCTLAEGVPPLLKLLLAMQFLDLLSGTLAARAVGERVNSRRFGTGMKRKMLMLLAVVSALTFDAVFAQHGFTTGGMLFKWATSWFIATEALSLYENADRMGVPLPPFLKGAAEALLQKAGQKGTEAGADLSAQLGVPTPAPALPAATPAPDSPAADTDIAHLTD